MAFDEVVVRAQGLRHPCGADVARFGATRMKGAARRGIERIGEALRQIQIRQTKMGIGRQDRVKQRGE